MRVIAQIDQCVALPFKLTVQVGFEIGSTGNIGNLKECGERDMMLQVMLLQ
jgi:hypothetical protein